MREDDRRLLLGDGEVACGRATPTIIAASAASRIAIGRWRRQPGTRSTTFGSSAGVANRAPAARAAALVQRRRARPAPARRRARSGRAVTGRSPGRPAQEGGERPQPVTRGREDDVPGARRGDRAGHALRSPAAAAAKRARSFASRESTWSCRPVSGSTSQSSPRSGSSCSRGSRISIATTSCRPARSSRGGRQSSTPRKSETTATSARCRAIAPVWRSASPSESRRPVALSGSSRSSAEQADQADPALARRRRLRLAVAERDDAQPVAASRGDAAERERDPLGDVRLAPVGSAELHRRRRVEDEPGHEHALRQMDANVRLAGTGGDVPVDAPDVVAGRVRPHLCELRADPHHRRAVVAGQQAVDAAADADVERAQQLLGDRPGPGPGGGGRCVGRTAVTRLACGRGRSAGRERPRARGRGCRRGSPPPPAPGR